MPAKSKAQQRFMGMVRSAQKGETPASGKVAKVAKSMKKSDVKKLASTKHRGLPKKMRQETKVRSLIRKMVREAMEEGGPGSGRLKRGSGQADKMVNRAYGLGPKPKKRENPFYGIHGDDEKKKRKNRPMSAFRKSLVLEGGPGSGRKSKDDSDRKPDITMQMADREKRKMITKKDKGTLSKIAQMMKNANK